MKTMLLAKQRWLLRLVESGLDDGPSAISSYTYNAARTRNLDWLDYDKR